MSRERDTEQVLTSVRDTAAPARREAGRGGEVEAGLPPLVPRVAGEILDSGLDLLRSRAAVLIGVCALLWLPVRILQPIVGVQPVEPGTNIDEILGQLVGTAIVTLAGALVQGLANAVMALLVFDAAQGKPLDVAAALGRALRRFPGVLVLAILAAIATTTGMLLCIVPAFFVAWKFALAPLIYVIEEGGVADALRRSFMLSTGSFLRWAGLMTVTALLLLPYSGLVGAADHPLVLEWLHQNLGLGHGVLTVLLVLLTSLFMGIVGAAGGVISTVFYVDCLVRREGRDLRARIASLSGARP